MTLRATRVRLIRNLARAADHRRLARVLDRLPPADLTWLLGELDALELRRAASVLLATERLDTTLARLNDEAFVRLTFCATDADACRALQRMLPARAAAIMLRLGLLRRDALLAALSDDVRLRIVRRLPRAHRPRTEERTVRGVLRLRRLFA